MARVVPSQVVALIDQAFPTVAEQREGQDFMLTMGNAPQLAAIVDLVERIPDELVTLDGRDFAVLRVCVTGITTQINRWFAHGNEPFYRIGGVPHLSPVTLIRRLMLMCPDEAPAAGTSELGFIGDQGLRESIRLDISAANRDLVQGEWKGATVLAGSAVEALLLWAIQRHEENNQGSVAAASTALVATRVIGQPLNANPERWDLHEYVEVAAHLQLIEAETAIQARQAKSFRNLIHPGRAARLGQKCGRGTAFSALAAVELVVRDLTPS
jgi:hypothetical protein